MRLRGRKFAAYIAVGICLIACQRQAEIGSENTPPEASKPIPMQIVTDDLERQISVPVKVTRVVSTAPSVTEMIFAVGAGDRLVGVTTFCDHPEQVKAIPKIGDTMNPNIETIIALKPDIVFVSTASQIEAFMKVLDQNGIAVYVMNAESLFDVSEDLRKLGALLQTASQAEQAATTLDNRRHAIHNELGTCPPDEECDHPEKPPLPVFVQISKEPLFTIGREAFLNDIVNAAGGRSVTSDVNTAFPKLSKETASALNPEVIILSDSPDNQEPNDAFRNSPAVKNGRVYKINADIISRPGPRLVDALEQIAKLLHPESFPE